MSISEHYIAAFNLSRMMGEKDFKVKKSDLTRALSYTNEIKDKAEKAIAGKELPLTPNLKISDVNELATTLSQLDTTTLSVRLIPLLTAENVSPEIGMRMVEILKGLQNFLPPEFDADGASSLGIKFLWAARVANDPLWILNLLSNQQLTEYDVTVVSTLYPEIYESIVEAVLTESIEQYAGDRRIPRKIKLGLSILLQTPVLSVETLKAYQDNDDQDDKQITPAEPKDSANLDIAHTESEKI
jgi:hypothetical protein